MHVAEQTSGRTLKAFPQLTFDLLKIAKMLSFLLNLCHQLPNQPTQHETKFSNFQGDDDSNTYLSELLLGFLKYKKYAH